LWSTDDGARVECWDDAGEGISSLLFSPDGSVSAYDGDFVSIDLCGGLQTGAWAPGDAGFECENGPGVILQMEVRLGGIAATLPSSSPGPCSIDLVRDGDWLSGTLACTLSDAADSPDVVLSDGSLSCAPAVP